jgi:hypothetical protein
VVFLAVTFQVLLQPPKAQAAPDPCKLPFGDKLCGLAGAVAKPGADAVQGAKDLWDGAGEAIDFASDPMGYIADAIRDAVASFLKYLTELLIGTTTQIDWGNEGFIRTYTMAFAASTVLTMVYWLIAVAKRAAQGVPPLQALGESIGFLLMAVLVTAFAPAVVYYAVKLFDQAAEAMFAPVADDIANMAVTITTALAALLVVPVGSFLLALIVGVWCELIVRNAMILTGLVFGPTVFAGLVDRALWDHTKRWISAMIAVIASKYVVLTCLALASGLLAHTDGVSNIGKSISTILTAVAMLCITLYLPFTIYRFIPGFGDDIQQMYQARDDFQGRAGGFKNAVTDGYDDLKERLATAGSAAATGGASEAADGAADAGGGGGGIGGIGGSGDDDPDDGGLSGDGGGPPAAGPDAIPDSPDGDDDPGGPGGAPPDAGAPPDPGGGDPPLPSADPAAASSGGGSGGGGPGGRSAAGSSGGGSAPGGQSSSAPAVTVPEPPPAEGPSWPPSEES